jgi:hypothetical protein
LEACQGEVNDLFNLSLHLSIWAHVVSAAGCLTSAIHWNKAKPHRLTVSSSNNLMAPMVLV